jgi:hypothetical protein
MLCCVGLLMAGLVAIGGRVPGAALVQAVASRILCGAALVDGCGGEAGLVAAYGSEVGELVREHMPALVFERGSRAVPVDFRRCRASSCGDAGEGRLVRRTEGGLPVTAFVHVVDCRLGEPERSEAKGADCSGVRAGHLYVQYWMYFADSATLRGVPVAGERGFHRDDWESVQFRIGPGGTVAQRASSHHGYNYTRGVSNWGADVGMDPLKDLAEAIGARDLNGWGPETGLLFVSGGSHAGNARALAEVGRLTPGHRVHLVPLEPIAAGDDSAFAVSPPWRKRVWRDPEAEGTD